MAGEDEIERLDPTPKNLTLSTGFEVELVRLKTRQFLRLLKILTSGLQPGALQTLNFGDDPEDFASKLVAMMMMAIPDAEPAAIAFLQSMLQPSGLVGGIGGKPLIQMSKQDRENDTTLWDKFQNELFNPEITDTVDVIEQIILQEAPELQALGKKLERLMKLAQKTGQLGKQDGEEAPEGPSLSSSDHSPEPSTSSPRSTGGRTKKSSTSRSVASVSA